MQVHLRVGPVMDLVVPPADTVAVPVTRLPAPTPTVISPKSAAVHVSNVLAKLGMSSRTEVAAWAIRDGLVGWRTATLRPPKKGGGPAER